MRDQERHALSRAAALLLAISLVRWVADARGGRPGVDLAPVDTGTLEGHIAATAAAADEADRRSRPLEDGERIDPRSADEVELDRLPGVGPSTAAAIVQARDTGLVFRRADDLLAVRGIGPATLERIRPRIELAGPTRASRPPPREPPARGRADAAATQGPAEGMGAPVDVNRADVEALRGLPGIGPALAERIVEERRARPFASLDDLQRVRGIGPATVARLLRLATAGTPRERPW